MELLISFPAAVPQVLHVPSHELEDKEKTVAAQLRQPMALVKELMVSKSLLSSAWPLSGHLVFRAIVPL